MNFVAGCKECHHLAARYEAATMEWFRVQGQLRVAEFSREEESSSRIFAELSAIAARRNALRRTFEKHETEAHAEIAVASGEVC